MRRGCGPFLYELVIYHNVYYHSIGGDSLKSWHFRENTWIRVFLQGVLYFCRPGGLAELVDCTGLENRRAERYRGFESLSLRLMKRPHDRGRFFCSSDNVLGNHANSCSTLAR